MRVVYFSVGSKRFHDLTPEIVGLHASTKPRGDLMTFSALTCTFLPLLRVPVAFQGGSSMLYDAPCQ